MIWVNLVKQSPQFGSINNPLDENATIDDSGWPTIDFSLAALSQVSEGTSNDQWPAVDVTGIYTVYATGNATITPICPACSLLNATYDAAANEVLAYVSIDALAPGTLWLNFTNTSRGPGLGAGLTNITVLQPGYNRSRADDFSDAYLDHLSRFDTIRTLGWTLNQPDIIVNWSDRALLSDPSYIPGAYAGEERHDHVFEFPALGTPCRRWCILRSRRRAAQAGYLQCAYVYIFFAPLPGVCRARPVAEGCAVGGGG